MGRKVRTRPRDKIEKKAKDGGVVQPEDNVRESSHKPKEARTKRRKLDSAKEHKKSLELLEDKDPEFFKYLQEHDKTLLDFDLSDDDNEGEEDQSALDEDEEEDQGGESSSDSEIGKEEAVGSDDQDDVEEADSRSIITSQMVDRWCQASKNGVLGATKNLLRAFRSACRFGDDEESSNSDEMVLGGSEVLNRVMLNTLSGMHTSLAMLLNMSDSEGAEIPNHPSQSKRWRKVEPLARMYLVNTTHALEQMSEDAMVSFTLRALRNVCRVICAYEPRRYAVKLVRHASRIWASHSALRARLAAFLFLRDILVSMNDSLHRDSLKKSFQEQVIKAMYKIFSTYTKFVKPSMLPFVKFCQNSLAEIASLIPEAGYMSAFGGIRDLAVELRQALQAKDKNAFKTVYSWQYICKLELWERVLSQNSKNETFLPLVYPLSQLLQAVIRASVSAKLFPLRIRLIHAINDLSDSTGCYSPVSGFVLSILEFKGFSKALDGSANINTRPGNFDSVLRVPESALSTKTYQESAISAALEALARHMCLWASSISFPEMAFPITAKLRTFSKSCRVDRFRKKVKLLVQAIDDNAAYIIQRRSKECVAPKDLVEIGYFQKRDVRDINPLSEFYNDIRTRRSDNLASQYIKDIKIPNDFEVRKDRSDEDVRSRELDATEQRNQDYSLESVSALKDTQDFQEDVLEALDFSDDEDA